MATYKREVELCQDCQRSSSSSANVIKVVEDFVEPQNCYVVMEKFEGHLRKGLKYVGTDVGQTFVDLGDTALKNLVRQVASGIAHLHRNAIVHRDVKAHNLLLDRLDLRDT